MAEYVSGEQFEAIRGGSRGRRKASGSRHALAFIVVLVLVAALSFYGGTAYQKSKQTKTTTVATSQGYGGGGRFGGGSGQRPTFGQVTAVSPSSITVQNSRTGTSDTLSITSSTQITNNGQNASASDIQVGDSVVVMSSTTTTTQADRIIINPDFGGPTSSTNSTGMTQ